MSEKPIPEVKPGRLDLFKAIGCLALATLCFDTMSVLVRMMITSGYSPQELSAYRNVLGIVPSLLLLVVTGELRLRGSSLYITRWRLALMRGLAVALAQLFFYTAIGKLELATVSALGQTYSLFIVAMSVVLLPGTVGPWRWIAVAVGFSGALLILQPGSDAFSIYALLPIGAAACYASTTVTIPMFDRSISNALLYLYSSVGAALGAIALAAMTTSFNPIASLADAGLIFVMSIVGGTGVLFLMLANRLADPSAVAPFGYFGIFTAFGMGWLFFGEFPVDTLFPGVFLIVGAGLLIIWRENRQRAG